MLSCWSTDSTMFSGFVSRISLRSFGSSTGIDVTTTGIVIRKMISSTSITSTNGVVLIVEIASSSSPDAGPTLIAMASRLGGGPGSGEQHRVQLAAERAHLLHHRLVATHQPVVAQHRRHRDGQAERGHDQRFADGTRHLVDRGLPGYADGGQRVVDAPHGAKQSDERSRRAHRCEEREAVLRAALHVVDRALDRHA